MDDGPASVGSVGGGGGGREAEPSSAVPIVAGGGGGGSVDGAGSSLARVSGGVSCPPQVWRGCARATPGAASAASTAHVSRNPPARVTICEASTRRQGAASGCFSGVASVILGSASVAASAASRRGHAATSTPKRRAL